VGKGPREAECFDVQVALGYGEPLPANLETVAEDALALPISGRALLVEKLLASLAGEVNAAVERAHLDEIQARRAAVASGESGLINGTEAFGKARAAVQ
jgi:hypothetical protein